MVAEPAFALPALPLPTLPGAGGLVGVVVGGGVVVADLPFLGRRGRRGLAGSPAGVGAAPGSGPRIFSVASHWCCLAMEKVVSARASVRDARISVGEGMRLRWSKDWPKASRVRRVQSQM